MVDMMRISGMRGITTRIAGRAEDKREDTGRRRNGSAVELSRALREVDAGRVGTQLQK